MAKMLLANPSRRKKRPRRRTGVSLRRKSARRYRRNPIPVKGISANVKTGAVGAASALATDFVLQKIPALGSIAGGRFLPAVKAAVGIGLGMGVSKFLKNRTLGKEVADGAVTVALYELGKTMVGPTIGLNGYSDFYDGVGEYMNPPEMGYMGSGMTTGEYLNGTEVPNPFDGSSL